MNQNIHPIVLMYHGIVSQSAFVSQKREKGAELYDVTVENFHDHMEFLKTNNFLVTTFPKKDEKNLARKIIITFDDGELNNFLGAFPVLQEFEFPAYFFVIVNRIGHPGYMSWEKLRDLNAHGMVIGSHSLTHRILTELSEEELKKELLESKIILEKGLKKEVTAFSIPRGFHNLPVIEMIREAGYKKIFTSDRQNFLFSDNIGRIAVKGNWSLKRFEQAVNGRTPFSESVAEAFKNVSKSILGGYGYNQLRNRLLIDLLSTNENDKSPCPPIDKKDRRADAVGNRGWRFVRVKEKVNKGKK